MKNRKSCFPDNVIDIINPRLDYFLEISLLQDGKNLGGLFGISISDQFIVVARFPTDKNGTELNGTGPNVPQFGLTNHPENVE